MQAAQMYGLAAIESVRSGTMERASRSTEPARRSLSAATKLKLLKQRAAKQKIFSGRRDPTDLSITLR
jgi:hypothetical protein